MARAPLRPGAGILGHNTGVTETSEPRYVRSSRAGVIHVLDAGSRMACGMQLPVTSTRQRWGGVLVAVFDPAMMCLNCAKARERASAGT